MISIRFLFGALLLALSQCQEDFITVHYTAENFITQDEQMFQAEITLITEPKIFMEIMDEAAIIDSRFRYTTIEYEGLGHYVTSINGVYEDVQRQLAWVLLKRLPEGDCRINMGITDFIPYDNEHVVYQLEDWDIHESLPEC